MKKTKLITSSIILVIALSFTAFAGDSQHGSRSGDSQHGSRNAKSLLNKIEELLKLILGS